MGAVTDPGTIRFEELPVVVKGRRWYLTGLQGLRNRGRGPINGSNSRREPRCTYETAGIPTITVHASPHTCASILADAGVSAERWMTSSATSFAAGQ